MTAAAFSGAVAAVLGLGAVVVLVLLVWSTSPYPERGPDGALHVAAALWLLAHGVRLLRTDALTGAAAPIAVTPLLLSLPLAWLLYRTAGHAVLRQEERGFLGVVRPIGPVAVTCWFAAGYLAVAAAVVPWTGGGPLRAVPLSALLRLPPAACAVVVAGAWSACGRPSSVRLVARLPYGVRRTAARLRIPYGGLRVALRCAAGGTAVLAGGGALLSVGSLVWHGQAALDSLLRLAGSFSGRFAVSLLAVALLPDAAVWGAAYALGPGFAFGAHGWAGPGGVYGYPPLPPDFPLLAAVPAAGGRGHGAGLGWLAVVVPVAAGLVMARSAARAARERGWTAARTAVVTALAALCGAVAVASAAALASGPMGVAALSRFGPDPLLTGAAALAWLAAVAVPGALAARWHAARRAPTRRSPAVPPPTPGPPPGVPHVRPLSPRGESEPAR